MQVVFRAGHGDVEQATSFLDLGRGAGTEIGRHAAIDDVEQIDGLPLLAFGGVNRRQDQIVLVEQRHAGLVAGRVGRIQRELGQEALARRISGSNLLKLQQVSLTGLGILMDAVEMRFVPEARAARMTAAGRIAKMAVNLDGASRLRLTMLIFSATNEVDKINMRLDMAADRIVAQDYEVASRIILAYPQVS
jgi:hypothetical protein